MDAFMPSVDASTGTTLATLMSTKPMILRATAGSAFRPFPRRVVVLQRRYSRAASLWPAERRRAELSIRSRRTIPKVIVGRAMLACRHHATGWAPRFTPGEFTLFLEV